MARINAAIYNLNGGSVSRLALTRIDLSQMTICGEIVDNWLVSTLGWIGLRPGTQNNGATRSNQKPQFIPFVGTGSACSMLELTPGFMRIWNDDALVARTSVATAVNNGTFSTLTGWTSTIPSGGSATASGGYARLVGTGIGRTRITQSITVAGPDSGSEHGLRIVIPRGPIQLRIGTTSGADDIVEEMTLGTGTHSLAITLTGTFFLDLSTTSASEKSIDQINFESGGITEIPTPWGAGDIGRVRTTQQGDVIFCATRTGRQQRIESRSRRSWSVVEYVALNGPFLARKESQAVLTPSNVTGGITLTADRETFKTGHVGAIFELTHFGQAFDAILNGPEQYGPSIRVTGVGDARNFSVYVAGTFSATVTLQQAIGSPDAWTDYKTYTSGTTELVNDTYDNSIVYYRMGIKAGNYTSGAANAGLRFPGGTTVGRVRITSLNSSTSAEAEVTSSLGSIDGTTNWREGAWSDYRGWPRDVEFLDGRIWWMGKSLLYGSVSDDFTNYDDSTEGDSAPVVRSIATGPADGNLWLMKLGRLLVASATSVAGVRSSSLDEPITRTAFTAREIDQLGGADLAPAAIGSHAVYVGRSTVDLLEIGASADVGDFSISLLNRLNPEITRAGILKIAVQRRPEPRLWCVLADGTVAILTYNRDEKVIAWQSFVTDGFVEECEVLPNTGQDDILLCVNRYLNGTWTRRVERCSYEVNTVGGVTNHIADCARSVVPASPSATLTGLEDFNGKTIAVWTPSRRGYRVPVVGGSATIGETVAQAWVGLPYDGLFKSTKLAYAADLGTALLQKKRVERLGLAFDTTARIGVKTGRSLDKLDPLPVIVRGGEVDPNIVEDDIDEVASSYNDEWSTDSRFFIKASAPWPCRVKAAVVSIATHDAR